MGAEVTLCGPPTLIPRGIAEATGVSVAYDLDGLGEADVVYALRMQNERMSESFVPSLREYAARYQIDARRLGPRQLLMHPGPVNRGVELAPEVIDSPTVADHRSGGERPGGADGDPLRAADRHRARQARQGARARRPAADRTAGVTAPASPENGPAFLVQRDGDPAELVIRGARVLDPREGLDAARDVIVRGGEVAELAEPGGAHRRPTGAEVVEAEGMLVLPAFVDPHVHFRVPGPGAQGGPGDGHPGRRRGRLLRGDRDGQHAAADRLGGGAGVGQGAGRARGLGAGRVRRQRHPGDGGRGADRDGRAARRRRDRLLRRRPADPKRPRAAPGPPVPAPRGRGDRPARGGPRALGRRASCTRARSRRCSAWPASRRSPSRR